MKNRDELIEKISQQIVDALDLDDVVQIAQEVIVNNLSEYTDQELIETAQNNNVDTDADSDDSTD